MTDLMVERTRRSRENKDVRPIDLLRTVLADIQEGLIKPDQIAIIAVEHNGEGSRHWRYRAGMTIEEEMFSLIAAQHALLEDPE